MSDDKQALTAAQRDVYHDLTALERVGAHEQTRKALELMAFEGIPPMEAAKRAQCDQSTLYKALKKTKVKVALNQVINAIRKNAAQAAWLRIQHLSVTGSSERLKFDANRWIAGVDGISPVQKVEGRVSHNVQFTGFDYPDLGAKDITPKDIQSHDDD